MKYILIILVLLSSIPNVQAMQIDSKIDYCYLYGRYLMDARTPEQINYRNLRAINTYTFSRFIVKKNQCKYSQKDLDMMNKSVDAYQQIRLNTQDQDIIKAYGMSRDTQKEDAKILFDRYYVK